MPGKRVTIAVYAPCVPTLQCGDFDNSKLRLRQMIRAIGTAAAMCNERAAKVVTSGVADHPLAPPTAPDLKVFLGPEYFFRYAAEFYATPEHYARYSKKSTAENQGVVNPHRVYSEKEKNDVLVTLIAESRNYADMLLIPGSIFWVEEKTGLARQTVPIISNGECTYYNKHEDAGELAEAEKATLSYAGGSMSGIFDFDGVTFGLEVCKDHANDTLKTECETDGRILDLYFVISCGLGSTMPSKRPPVKNKGVYAICEGILPNSAKMWSKAVQQKSDGTWKKINPRKIDDDSRMAVYDCEIDF